MGLPSGHHLNPRGDFVEARDRGNERCPSLWTQATHQPLLLLPMGFPLAFSPIAILRAKHSRTVDPRTTTPPRKFVDDISHSPVVYFERLNGRNNHLHNDGRHHHVQSLFRVGETVLRRSRTKPSTLRPHKASTYDHVHALVQGIEEDPSSAVFSGKSLVGEIEN